MNIVFPRIHSSGSISQSIASAKCVARPASSHSTAAQPRFDNTFTRGFNRAATHWQAACKELRQLG